MLHFGTKSALAVAMAAGAALAGAQSAGAQYREDGVVQLHEFLGGEPGASYGWAVADMADIDGDGVRESIISAPFSFNFGEFAGRVEVRSSATGALLFDLPGIAGFGIGYSIADAGDTDNDGVNDIVAGGPFSGGRVLVWSGATGAVLHDITGLGGGLGTAVSGAGDIDGDDHDDFIAGAGVANANAGRAIVFSGADGSMLRDYDVPAGALNFGWATALTDDLDGDGMRDHFIGAPGSAQAFAFGSVSGLVIHSLDGPATAGAYAQFFVAGVNDLDGDGVGDLYVGDFADGFDPMSGVPAPGAAYVYSGATGALVHDFKGRGETHGVGPGRWAGDADGDGDEDLAIGAYTSNVGAPGSGRVVLFSGRDGGVLRTITSAIAGENLGFDAVGLGDVDGDGAPDYLLSAATGERVAIVAGRSETCAADLNGNGVVNLVDIALLILRFQDDFARGDLDGDGDVDRRDLVIMLTRLGHCP